MITINWIDGIGVLLMGGFAGLLLYLVPAYFDRREKKREERRRDEHGEK